MRVSYRCDKQNTINRRIHPWYINFQSNKQSQGETLEPATYLLVQVQQVMEVVPARRGIIVHHRSGKGRGRGVWSADAGNCAAGLGDDQNQKTI